MRDETEVSRVIHPFLWIFKLWLNLEIQVTDESLTAHELVVSMVL